MDWHLNRNLKPAIRAIYKFWIDIHTMKLTEKYFYFFLTMTNLVASMPQKFGNTETDIGVYHTNRILL